MDVLCFSTSFPNVSRFGNVAFEAQPAGPAGPAGVLGHAIQFGLQLLRQLVRHTAATCGTPSLRRCSWMSKVKPGVKPRFLYTQMNNYVYKTYDKT